MDLVQSIGEIDEYKDMVGNLARAIATPNLGDVFPFLTIFDLHGIRWSSRTYIPMLFNIFNDHIDKRLKLREEENYVAKSSNKDVFEALLNISQEKGQKMDTEKIKHLFLDLIIAGIDTSSYVVERAMTELLHNPNIMSKAKMELEQTIGIGNPLQESQIENLPYLEAIIKETLRKYPPAPFLLPRKAKENVEIHGYIIPKGAQVIINEWGIGRNPNIWDDPNLFSPKRFLGSNIDYVKGHDCNFTPFGGGRRICPGMKLATKMLHLMLGSMVNSFNWRLENDMKPEDMDLDQQLRAIAVRIN
ncbi:cytochrome P450 76C4-like [Arachis ipaensis]|nr:cytochrome P450 76C4-like [Arachis ipaensis]XP_025670169.1 cytochrome P450 76C4-like [Arachis hypogaea]